MAGAWHAKQRVEVPGVPSDALEAVYGLVAGKHGQRAVPTYGADECDGLEAARSRLSCIPGIGNPGSGASSVVGDRMAMSASVMRRILRRSSN